MSSHGNPRLKGRLFIVLCHNAVKIELICAVVLGADFTVMYQLVPLTPANVTVPFRDDMLTVSCRCPLGLDRDVNEAEAGLLLL